MFFNIYMSTEKCPVYFSFCVRACVRACGRAGVRACVRACVCVCVNRTFSFDSHNLQFIERQAGLSVLSLHNQRHITSDHCTFAVQSLCHASSGEDCGTEAHHYAGLAPCLFTLDAQRNPHLKLRDAWCSCRVDGNHR